jgi:hypothetical protein
MAYPSFDTIFDACYERVTHITYFEDKWSISLGLKNYWHPQLCLWTHNIDDGWVDIGRIDCLQRNISKGVCEVLVTTTEEVTVWHLHKGKFAVDRVICYVDGNMDDICERFNNSDKDVVPEYLIEFIQWFHDLKKSASRLS